MANTTEIRISWASEDVLEVDDSLTPEQVGMVLDHLQRKHDATIGINWDVIGFTIDYILEKDQK